ncbi:MAG: hypothetical protein MJE77_39805 [Proteobacteria bacterium]|nr:hypothetical protein [Pseudomonadota bacterium]
MRQLIIVPIVHGEEDTGSLRAEVDRAFRRRLGKYKLDAHKRAIRDFWSRVGQLVQERDFDAASVLIYQDGLPVCGRELEMVRELAASGSQNHQIVANMVDRGASIVGTEDPSLIVQELQRIKKQISARPHAPRRAAPSSRAAIAKSLEPRDRFIAARIDQTLNHGQIGLLFIGLMHDVRPHLPADIEVEYLIEPTAVLQMTAS